MTLPQLKNKLQKLTNEYVRKRDSQNGYAKCISCGKIMKVGTFHAGHYYPAGKYENLRFDTDNIHAQCVKCNYYEHGNQIEYRKNLIKKIGQERVDRLDLKAGYYKKYGHKWSRFTLEQMILEMKQKLKEWD